MDADLNERNESMVLYRIIKMHSSDREDGCPINSGIVSIYYSSISNWELFIYKCIGIYINIANIELTIQTKSTTICKIRHSN